MFTLGLITAYLPWCLSSTIIITELCLYQVKLLFLQHSWKYLAFVIFRVQLAIHLQIVTFCFVDYQFFITVIEVMGFC